jgi:hypothetical protein
MTATTLTNAITSTVSFIVLGSTTGLSAGYLIQVGDEYMEAVEINSTTVKVRRGVNGSRATTHGATEPVYFGTSDEFNGQGEDYNPRFGNGLFLSRTTPTSQIATAGAATYTAGQLKAGIILRDPNGAGRTDTLPTAALLLAAFPGVQIGSTFEFVVENQADAAETITIAAGTGGTAASGHTLTIAQNNSKRFAIRFTGVTPGSEAYTLYNRGTFTT